MTRKIGRSTPQKSVPQVGEIWWCDGATLAFEAYFKRRPVLIVAIESPTLFYVQPLSSRQRYGQEQAITHTNGVSYMTGAILSVDSRALLSRIGVWDDFPQWQAEQLRIAQTLKEIHERGFWWQNLLRRFQKKR